MMVGLFIALWSVPMMSMSHLMFSAGMSLYIFIGVHFEERGLRVELGQPYQDYAARTGRFCRGFSCSCGGGRRQLGEGGGCQGDPR